MKIQLLTMLSATLMLGCMAAPVTTVAINGPNWVGPQEGNAAFAYYPTEARKKGVPGIAIVTCVMGEANRLRSCEVQFENRPGWGFGAAALRMAEQVRTQEAIPVGRTTMQLVSFCVDEPGCRENAQVSREIRAKVDEARARSVADASVIRDETLE